MSIHQSVAPNMCNTMVLKLFPTRVTCRYFLEVPCPWTSLALMQAVELSCTWKCFVCDISAATAHPLQLLDGQHCSIVLWVLVSRYAPPADISALSRRPVQISIVVVRDIRPPSAHVSQANTHQVCQPPLLGTTSAASNACR